MMKSLMIMLMPVSSLVMLGVVSTPAWSQNNNGDCGHGWMKKCCEKQTEAGVERPEGKQIARPQPVLESAIRQMLESVAGDNDCAKPQARPQPMLESAIRQMLESMTGREHAAAQDEIPSALEPALRQILGAVVGNDGKDQKRARPTPVVIRFNHISANSFAKTIEQLCQNQNAASILKEISWAVNDDSNAIVVLAPSDAKETLVNLARELDLPRTDRK